MQSKSKSVFIFFVLTFIFSIPFWLLNTINPIQLLPGLPISAISVFIPALTALILVYKNEHLSGALQLLKRSFDFNRVKNKSWYLAFIFINPAIAVLAYWVMRMTGMQIPNSTPLTFTAIPLFVILFIAALGEEIGWSGYATEPLQSRWGTLAAGLVIGLVWAAVHFVPLWQVNRSMEWIAWWSLGTISSRLIMTWLYTHTGKSVSAAAIFHAMINLSWQLFPVNGSFYDPRLFSLGALGFAVIIFGAESLFKKRSVQVA